MIFPTMVTTFQYSLHRVLEQFHQHLQRAVGEFGPHEFEDALSLEALNDLGPGDSQLTFRIEGPEGISFRLTLEVFPISDYSCDVRAETEEGHARHFTCDLPSDQGEPEGLKRVARSIATFIFNEVEQRRDQASSQPSMWSDPPPHVPLLVLDEDGTIQNLTEAAGRILGYSPEASVEPNFFSHVHGQNMRRVMRDIAHMVSHQKESADWLLRLRTGNQRWRWYRAAAKNHLSEDSEGAIRVLLRPLSER